MNLDELFDYKNRLMKEICTNEDIVHLVTNKADSAVPNMTLPYSQVFPYEFVPETVDNGQTFICFDVDISYVYNKTMCAPVLYIWVFTHKDNLRLPEGGVRIDKIAVKLDEMLNGSRFYGLGTLDLSSVERFVPITDYLGRVLTYSAAEWNRYGTKMLPINRKQQI